MEGIAFGHAEVDGKFEKDSEVVAYVADGKTVGQYVQRQEVDPCCPYFAMGAVLGKPQHASRHRLLTCLFPRAVRVPL